MLKHVQEGTVYAYGLSHTDEQIQQLLGQGYGIFANEQEHDGRPVIRLRKQESTDGRFEDAAGPQ